MSLLFNLVLFFSEKTEVFLEVFGNSEIRSQTEEIVRQAASQLHLFVTETIETSPHDCLNTTYLKVEQSARQLLLHTFLYNILCVQE